MGMRLFPIALVAGRWRRTNVASRMRSGRTLHLRLDSTLSAVEAAEIIVQKLAKDHGVDDDDIEKLSVAVREIAVNAVTHGNCYNKEKSVYLSVVTSPTQLSITIRDEGKGFNPDAVPDPTAGDNLLKNSGRGLLLSRAFVDEIRFRPVSPQGTEVVMVKKIPQTLSEKEEEEVSLATNVREVDGVTVVDLSGRITLGEGSGKLRDTVREILGKGQKKIVLNLGDVGYIDSSGLGELVSSYTTAANQGAKVKLVNLQQKVSDLLQITKLYTVFETFESEPEALLSF
jgi:anti-sigma B factor antagonist